MGVRHGEHPAGDRRCKADQEGTGGGGGEGNFNQLINADKGEGYGVEIDGDVYLGAGFSVLVGFAWNHTEIKDSDLLVAFCGAACTVTDPIVNVGTTRRANIDGNPFPQAPEYTANISLNYEHALANGSELFASTDWVMQKNFNLFLYKSVEFMQDTAFEGGVRAGWRDTSRSLEAAVYVRNVTDEANVIGAIDFNNLTAFVNAPRTYGVQLTKRL